MPCKTDYIERGEEIPESIILLVLEMLEVSLRSPSLRERVLELERVIFEEKNGNQNSQ